MRYPRPFGREGASSRRIPAPLCWHHAAEHSIRPARRKGPWATARRSDVRYAGADQGIVIATRETGLNGRALSVAEAPRSHRHLPKSLIFVSICCVGDTIEKKLSKR